MMSANNVHLVTETISGATAEIAKAADDLAARITAQKAKTLDGLHVVNAFVDDWEKANTELANLTNQLTNGPAPEAPHTA
jgi:methyl-accepting chemotaxis protein